MKNLTGHFQDACRECKKEWNLYSSKGIGFKPVRKKWMQDLCMDCADLNCTPVIKGRRLGINIPESEKRACRQALTRAERIKSR